MEVQVESNMKDYLFSYETNIIILGENSFSGLLPWSLFNLTHLYYLDFSENQLVGHLPYQVVNGLSNLTHLHLSHNFLNGTLPSWLFALPSLHRLDLRNNSLLGPIPKSIGDLVNLENLDLSWNNLSGIVTSDMFSKLKNLYSVDLSRNRQLSLRTSENNLNFTLPNLHDFRFSSCNITEFPVFLRTSENLQSLDLSDNKIPGLISQSEFVNLQNLFYLNLSHNFLTSFEQITFVNLENLQYLDLSSNLLQGPLVDLPLSMQFFSVSNNRFTGNITSSLCNMHSIEYLILANNNLTGIIPQCLGNSSQLLVLDLQMNNFHGSIPQTSFANFLLSLNLNGNQLHGPLPPSLVNCRYLEVLDVGNNKINDTFPHWLATLPNLQVLILRSNAFHGLIADTNASFSFPMLRIVDLSYNGFTGPLPTRLFENFIAMTHNGESVSNEVEYMTMGDRPYRYSVTLTMKGNEIQMERVLTIFTTIDLSKNQFGGNIPEIVGKLNSLKLLNFSHNNLVGQIPSSLENLTELESLDLSSNKLTGQIPMELASLTSLAVLNLSYNQLVGPIPQGPQFNTFPNDSFMGNPGLCGFQISEKCSNDETPKRSTSDKEGHTSRWFDWNVIMMGYGCGVVLGLSTGYIVFSTGKPWWFVRIVESKLVRIENRRSRRRRRRRN